jgi:N-acetylneuraminic acid mutarotase
MNWLQVKPLPKPRGDATAAVVDGVLYVIGGYHPDSSPKDSVFALNQKRNEWRKMKHMPTARWGPIAVAIEKRIFVFGGMTPRGFSDVLEVYDIERDSWTRGAPMPARKRGMVAFVWGGLVHIIGGQDDSWPSGPIPYPGNSILNKHDIYNPETDSYSSGVPMQFPRTFALGALLHEKFYVIGGCGPDGLPTDKNEAFALDSQTWSPKSPLPLKLYGMARENPVLRGKIISAFGFDNNDFQNVGFAYDPDVDQWETLPKSSGLNRDGIAGGVIGSTLYFIGGRNRKPPQRIIGLRNCEALNI